MWSGGSYKHEGPGLAACLEECPHFALRLLPVAPNSPLSPPDLYVCVSDQEAQTVILSSLTPTSVAVNSLLWSGNKLGKYCQEGNYEDHN